MITADDFLKWLEVFRVPMGGSILPIPSTNLISWQDATDPLGNGTIPGTDSIVPLWIDKSGNSNHFIFNQSTGGPNYFQNMINGLPIMNLDATTGQSYTIPANVLLGASGFTLYVVYQLQHALVSNQPLIDFGSASTNYLTVSPNQSGGMGRYFKILSTAAGGNGDFYTGNVPSISTPYLDTYVFDVNGSLQHMRVNGVEQAITIGGSGGLPYPSTLQFCMNNGLGTSNVGSSPGTTNYGEIIVYGASQTLEEIEAIEAYLLNKWNLPGSAEDWRNWNNSADTLYQNLGSVYADNEAYQTIAVARISDTKFVLVYGGTGATLSAVVGTYNYGAQPTYGTPVLIDQSLVADMPVSFEVLSVGNVGTAPAVYIGYSTPQSGGSDNGFIYGVIASVNDNSITLGSKTLLSSGQTAGAGYPGRQSAVLAEGSLIATLYQAEGLVSIVSTLTINSDLSLTQNDEVPITNLNTIIQPLTSSLVALSSHLIVVVLSDGNADGNILYAYTFPVVGVNVQNYTSYVEVTDIFGFRGVQAVSLGNLTDGFIAYTAIDESNHELVQIQQFNVTAGTITVSNLQNVIEFSTSDVNSLHFDSIIPINNSLNQYLCCYSIIAPNDNAVGKSVQVITPTDELTLDISSTIIDICANNNATGYWGIPDALSDQSVVFPVTAYDGAHYGLKILNVNTVQSTPYRVFKVDAITNVRTQLSAPISVAVNGTSGQNTVVVPSLNLLYLNPGTTIVLGGTDNYTLESVAFNLGNSTLTLTSNLTKNYVNVDLNLTLINNIVDQYNGYSFGQSDQTMMSAIGTMNSLPAICQFVQADGTTFTSLTANNISWNINNEATFFIVMGAVNAETGSPVATQTMADGVGQQINVQQLTTQISNGGLSPSSVGSYNITELTLITVVRRLTGSECYINGTLNATQNYAQTPIGELLSFTLGGASTQNVSACELWNGALDAAQREAIEAAYIAKYSL